MNSRSQTFYYHIGNQVEKKNDIQIKVTLRKIVSSSTSSSIYKVVEEEEEEEEEKVKLSCYHNIEKIISWQEKIPSPIESSCWEKNNVIDHPNSQIAELSTDKEGHKNETTNDSEKHCDNNDDEAIIYTYIDTDFYCIPRSQEIDTYSSSFYHGKTSDTHLKDIVTALPAHNLYSSHPASHRSGANVHDRLSRDDPFQVMYILAAVDYKYDDLDRKGIRSSDENKFFHQELLCSMKLYSNGMLEVSPGFSNREAEDSDDELFVSSEALHKIERKGVQLSTFSFATSRGSIYQYSLEWIDYLVEPNVLEGLVLREVDEQYRLLSQHRRDILRQIEESSVPIDCLTCIEDETLIQIQFVSASGFHPKWNNSSLSIEYDISVPQRSDSITGSTMVVGLVPTSDLSFPNIVGLKIIIIFCLLVLILISDTNVIMAFLLFVITKLTSSTIFYHSCDVIYSKEDSIVKYYFGHNVSILESGGSVCNNTEQIRCFLQVCATNQEGMKTILGYGSVCIPIDCGNQDLNVQTCKLVPSQYRSYWNNLIFTLNDRFFGCSLGGIENMKYMFMNCRPTERDTMTQPLIKISDQVTSIPSGTVHINVSTISKQVSSNTDKHGSERVRYMLDEVLSKVRRQKRSGGRQYLTRHDNSLMADKTFDKTEALLTRIKARKDARRRHLR